MDPKNAGHVFDKRKLSAHSIEIVIAI